MSKLAYTKGVVIITCDGCSSKHLIADHLGWYEHGSPAGTIEDILAKKGESVQKQLKVIESVEGMNEVVPNSDEIKLLK
jgi:protein import protein ZIM17